MLNMPLLKLETTVDLSEDRRQALLASLSKTVAETIGKPQQYVMVAASQAAMQMSGSPGDAAFVDVRSIGGLTDDVTRMSSTWPAGSRRFPWSLGRSRDMRRWLCGPPPAPRPPTAC